MNYSNDPGSVRVDFFSEHGQWLGTEAVRWDGAFYSGQYLRSDFATVLREHFGNNLRHENAIAVCLHPFHKFADPIMLKVKAIWDDDLLARIAKAAADA